MAAPSGGKPTPAQVRRKIDRLDLARINRKAITEYRWRPARAREAELWYRNFLWLCYKNRSPVAAIGKDADDFWHLHILDTRKYAADCKKVFGRFLEHRPLYGPPGPKERNLFTRTQALYISEFGATPRLLKVRSWSVGQKGSPSA